MPLKERSKICKYHTTKPGIARSHLELNFPDLPASQSDLKNGHVLNLFLSNDKSQPETGRKLSSHFSWPHGELCSAVKSSVQVLVTKTLLKFKKLSNPKELDEFSRICDEPFKLKRNPETISSNDIAGSAAIGKEPSSSPASYSEPSTSGWEQPILLDKSLETTAGTHDLSDSNVATPTTEATIPPGTGARKDKLPEASTRISTNYIPQCNRLLEDTIAGMTPTQKTKKVASSLPCEVFFACTRCGSRSRTVPQLHTHYRTVHKEEIANGSLTSRDTENSSRKKGDTSESQNKTGEAGGDANISSRASDKASTEKGRERLNPTEQPGTTTTSQANDNGQDKKEGSSDVIYVEGSKTPAKSATSGPVINHPEKDCVITRKRNVPLGMLEGKKNSLMVIFQHSDQNKPLPEGSSFKLRNAGGEQTYMVVANVDVDIIEQGKPVKKMKSGD